MNIFLILYVDDGHFQFNYKKLHIESRMNGSTQAAEDNCLKISILLDCQNRYVEKPEDQMSFV